MGFDEALANLGGTAEEIAKSLVLLNIKGRIGNEYNCPIARYIKKVCKPWSGATVEWWGVNNNDYQILDYHFKKPVQDFIAMFDNKKFPELIEG